LWDWFSGLAGARRPESRLGCRPRLEGLEERTLLSPGDLDPTFGNGGLVITPFPGYPQVRSSARSVAVQPDGRLVVAGNAGPSNAPRSGIALARYDSDGSLDTSFGTGGLVDTYINDSGNDATINTVLLQPDGRILAVGWDIVGPGTKYPSYRGVLARYNSDGSLDTSFGRNGIATPTHLPGVTSVSDVAALQPDGHILVAVESGLRLVVARYNSDGSVDSSFGTGGVAATDFSDSPGVFTTCLALQPDGDIVAAGYAYTSSTSLVALTRFHPDGSVDTSFGAAGRVATAFPDTPVQAVSSVAVQADGGIVVAGRASRSSQDLFALARYDSDGSLDTSFGTGGLVTTSFGSSTQDALAVALQPNGRIVAVGYVANRFALARYDPDGSLDESFGTGGLVTTSPITPGGGSAWGVAIQPDGRIAAVGGAYPGGPGEFALARYEGDAVGTTRFEVNTPAEVTAGQPFDVTVTALDDNGNVVPDYAGTVTLSSTDPLAPALGSHTFTTADGGVFTFTAVQLFTAGPQSVIADDGSLNGQAELTVDPGLAVGLLLTGPDHAIAAVPVVVTVTAVDAWGNVATGYTGTVWLEATDSNANLPDAWDFTADDAGTHQFTVTLRTPGPVRLTAHDSDAGWDANLDLIVV
jgi:uncharacterized delta-60 repeat protein